MRCRTIIKFRNSDDPNDLGFGRGIVQLLEGVEELGSINRATASMGMAYSKAWKIIIPSKRNLTSASSTARARTART